MRSKLKRGEEVIYTARKHWFTMFKPMLLLCSAIVVSPYLYGKWGKMVNYAVIGYTVFAIAYFIYRVYDIKFDIWVITNRRIIDEWGVISHNFKESPIDKINNVMVKQTVLGRVFGYGDVEIQTAAEAGDTTIVMVQSPEMLQETVLDVIEEAKRNQPAVQNQPATVDNADLMECPFCAELIKKKAKICRYCGRELIKPVDEVISPSDNFDRKEEKEIDLAETFDPKVLWKT